MGIFGVICILILWVLTYWAGYLTALVIEILPAHEETAEVHSTMKAIAVFVAALFEKEK